MSSRALRKLQQNVPVVADVQDEESESEESVVQEPKKNLFALLNDNEDDKEDVASDDAKDVSQNEVAKPNKKKKKKKKKKGKDKIEEKASEKQPDEEDEIDASIREVNRLLSNGNIGETGALMSADTDTRSASNRALLMVEHRFLNSENELKKIFGTRVIREEATRRRPPTRRRQKASWMAQPTDSWPPAGRIGLSMSLRENKDGVQYFIYEHNHQYQKVQFQFYDAVESLNPENIGGILQVQPYHVDGLLQLSEVFRMNEDMNMAAELIERALYTMEMAFHPLFNMTQGTCRLEYKYRENRAMHLALFKHIASMGQRGCNRTALEFCKFLLSLDPENDPLCAMLMIDFYAIRSAEYAFLIRMCEEWEADRNLSQLPNFAFSLPLAYFHMENVNKADQLLQDGLMMFPGMLVPLLDKCSVQGDNSVSHQYFKMAEQSEPVGLKQLIAVYVGRCYSCWKVPEVMEWLERNVKLVIERVDKADPLIITYKLRRESRYKGTPYNIYRHILISEIPSATATIPQDVASTVLGFDPLPPKDSVLGYTRPTRPNRAQAADGNAITMFLRSLMPNYNPNEPAEEQQPGAVGGPADANQLRQGVGALMDAMRDLLNNIQMVEAPTENQEDGEQREQEEWD